LKSVNLNQLLNAPKSQALSFFLPAIAHSSLLQLKHFLEDLKDQLSEQNESELLSFLSQDFEAILKIAQSHPQRECGFFFNSSLQGYCVLETPIESFFTIGPSFHVRPMIEEYFSNPEFIVVNVSLYDIKVYRGNFHHLEVTQVFEFDDLKVDSPRIFTPKHIGLIPFRHITAMRTIANGLADLVIYHSLPIVVTGLADMKEIFIKYLPQDSRVITGLEMDLFEKTCVQVLEACRRVRSPIFNIYSEELRDRFLKMKKGQRLVTDLSQIIRASREGKVLQLVIPHSKKLWGQVDLVSGEYELSSNRGAKVDILNEVAEEVIRQGGKIHVLDTRHFPEDVSALAVFKVGS
jgi:hypothetical protein